MSIDKSLNLSEFSNHDELHESTARKHGDAAAQLATISGAMMACRGGGQTGGWRGPGDQTPVGSLSWCIKESWAPSSGAVATGKWSMDDASDGLVSSPSPSTASAARHPPRHSLHICGSLLAQFGYSTWISMMRGISKLCKQAPTNVQVVADFVRLHDCLAHNHIRLACLQAIQKNTPSPRPIRAFLPSTATSNYPSTPSLRAESSPVTSVRRRVLRTRTSVSAGFFSSFQSLS